MGNQNTIDRVYELLFSGQAEKAVSLIESRRIEVTQELDTLDKLIAQYNKSKKPQQSINIDTAPIHDDIEPARSSAKMTKAAKNKRRRDILKVAHGMPPSSSFSSDDVITIMSNQNYDFGVPKNRISTTVGGILARDDDFERIDTGIFKKKQVNSGLMQVNQSH